MTSSLQPVGGTLPVEDHTELTVKRQIRAIVADDFGSMRQALVNCLQSLPGYEVVATAANGQEALDQATALRPDVVIADLLMPVMNGFQLFATLRRSYPEMRLIAVSGHYSPAIENEAKSAGADAFVPKNGLPQDLISILEKLL